MTETRIDTKTRESLPPITLDEVIMEVFRSSAPEKKRGKRTLAHKRSVSKKPKVATR
jgi:hypothetical protein